jgi:hypothetical protein
MDPSNPQVLYVGTDSGGVFKSTNGGESWVAKGLTGPEVGSLAIDPSNPQVVYAGTWGLFKWIPSSGITVTFPNGGGSWTIGSTKNITWTSSNLTGNMKIELSRNYPSGTWEVLFASTPNDGNESWQVTGPASSSCRIRISSLDDPSVYDISDGNFTIEEGTPGPTLSLTSPQGGELWAVDSEQTLTWTSSNLTGNMKIELSRNYPSGTWEVLFASTPNDGNESWQVTGPASSSCRIRISSLDDPSVYDISDGNFTIEEGTPGPAHMPSLSPWGLALLGVSLLTVAAFGITGAKRKKA